MSETDAKGPRVWVLAYDSNFDDYPPIVVFGPEISPSEMEVPVIEKSAYDQLAKELAAAEAERDKLICGDLYKHWEKQNIELRAENRRLNLICEQEFGRADSVGELVKRCAELEAENDQLRSRLAEQIKDHADDRIRIQNAERKLAAAEAALKHDVDKIEAAYINERTELLRWADRLTKFISDAQCECSVAERDSGHLVGCWRPDLDSLLIEFHQWREKRGEG